MAARHRNQPWTRVSLRAPDEAIDAVVALFVELGAPGAVTGERDLRRTQAAASRTAATRVEAYFPPDVSARRLAPALSRGVAQLRASFPGLRAETLRSEPFVVPDYGEAWRAHFPPLAVGKRLLILPPWAEPAEQTRARARLVLRIDPGQAFGTGHHATTRGCLVAIERECAARPVRRGLDVGCGSGILALAMRRLGVRQVLAVDTDPLARAATLDAARANAIDGVRVASSLAAARGRFDLIAANLFANLLAELAPALAARLAPDGALIVSGLLASQEQATRRAFADAGLAVSARQCRSTWVTLTLRCAARRAAQRRHRA